MLEAILRVSPAATSIEVARWVKTLGTEDIDRRARMLAANEESWRSSSKMTFASSTHTSSLRNVLAPATAEAVAAIALTTVLPPAARPARRFLRPIHLVPVVVAIGALAGAVVALAPASSTALRPQGAASSVGAIAPVAAAPPPAPMDTLPSATPPRPGTAAPQPPAHPVRPLHVAAPASPTPSPAVAPPADSASPDCNPPFYFYGSRKVFKTGCL
jgi:hypothetical protein